MFKKILCLLLSVVLSGTIGGSFVAASEEEQPAMEATDTANHVVDQNPEALSLRHGEAIRELESVKEKITDRYIIKRKSEALPELQRVIAQAHSAAEEAKERHVAGILEQNGTTLERTLNNQQAESPEDIRLKEILQDTFSGQPAMDTFKNENTLTSNADIQPLQSDKQVIILSEKVEPDTFVQRITEQLGEAIEYIQPDYELELSANEETARPLELLPQEQAAPENQIQEQQTNTPALAETVTVAVIDTGIDTTHPDLASHMVPGYDFYNDSTSVYDPLLGMAQAHGTHVAGIIAQTAPDAKIMPLKCFQNGRAYTSDLIEAIDYAKANGASIVNCSWGSKDNNQALKEAMENSGLFFVCAAGNNRMDVDKTPIYPASFGLENSISVTSLNQDYGFSYYSNYGTSIDIAAIGREVKSAFPGGKRGKMNGSSMSAGYVTGAAAIAKASGETNLKTRMISTGDRLSNLQNKLKDGRALNLDHLISNTQSDEILDCAPADDFDVHGYQPTPEESWELFSSVPTVQVAAGQFFSLALKEDGTVWSWGGNSYGELGDGTTLNNATPRRIAGLSNIKEIAAGFSHALAVHEDGSVYAWGKNEYGQVGDFTTTNRLTPTTVLDKSEKCFSISAGETHSMAVSPSDIYTWGDNSYKQLGTDVIDYTEEGAFVLPFVTDPVLVENMLIDGPLIAIATGNRNSIALKSDGTILVWGESGQMGLDDTNKYEWIIEFTSIPAKAVFAGGYHTFIQHENGTIYASGNNGWGQFGDGTLVSTTSLTPVPSLTNIRMLEGGYYCSFAVKEDGSLYAWGENDSGSLGLGDWDVPITPTLVTGISDVIDVSSCYSHTLAVTANGQVYAWGSNNYGELGNGDMSYSLSPVCLSAPFNPSGAPIVITANTIIAEKLWDANQCHWYSFQPRSTGQYSISKTGAATVELYNADGTVLPNNDLTDGQAINLTYPHSYLIKVSGAVGDYSFTINAPSQTNGRAFDTTIGGNNYYANFKDGGKLYMNTTKLTDTPAMWLCAGGNTLFYNSQGSIYKYAGTAMLLNAVNAYYIVSDGAYLYFANWSQGGKLYRLNQNQTNAVPELMCRDIGKGLSVNGDYLYYYNILDGGKMYRILKTATNTQSGELVQ